MEKITKFKVFCNETEYTVDVVNLEESVTEQIVAQLKKQGVNVESIDVNANIGDRFAIAKSL